MSTVEIKHVQAIDYIAFEMPEGEGGVRLFTGRNGAGKTTALKCLNALLGKKVSLLPSEGIDKGSVQGLGAKVSVSGRNRKTGDAELPNLEGRFDFSDLVDPPVKDPEARNKVRIRALVGLTAGKCSPSDFYELFGGQEAFEAIVDPDDLAGLDVLDMADRIKRSAEKLARVHEANAESAEAKWQSAVEQSKGRKADQEPESVDELAADYASARTNWESATKAIESHRRALESNKAVEAKLEQHAHSKPATEPAKVLERLKAARTVVAELEEKLARAKQRESELSEEFRQVSAWEERRIELESMLVEVAEALPDVADAEAAMNVAMDRLKGAEETRQQYDAAVRANKSLELFKVEKATADSLREAAAKTSSVVTANLPQGPLQVRDGILCAFHAGREKWIPVDEHSEGERWMLGLQVAIQAVGKSGVVPCDQEAWAALDSATRRKVSEMCRDAQVWLVSGQVGDGELRVEEA